MSNHSESTLALRKEQCPLEYKLTCACHWLSSEISSWISELHSHLYSVLSRERICRPSYGNIITELLTKLYKSRTWLLQDMAEEKVLIVDMRGVQSEAPGGVPSKDRK